MTSTRHDWPHPAPRQTQPDRINALLALVCPAAITTEAVLLEVGNSLARRRYRQGAVSLLRSLTTDANAIVEPITTPLFRRGLDLYEARLDKEWGLVDCLSFVVMWDRGVTEALTSDEHFEQAGFVALLR